MSGGEKPGSRGELGSAPDSHPETREDCTTKLRGKLKNDISFQQTWCWITTQTDGDLGLDIGLEYPLHSCRGKRRAEDFQAELGRDTLHH